MTTPVILPINFKSFAIRALLGGYKTQDRQIIEQQPEALEARPLGFLDHSTRFGFTLVYEGGANSTLYIPAPYQPGMLLWVREVWNIDGGRDIAYKTTNPDMNGFPWHPASSMPRWASRLTLELTEVRAERVRNITDEEAVAEGIHERATIGDDPMSSTWTWCLEGWRYDSPRQAYGAFWESTHGAGSWQSNPWTWVLSFKVHRQNVNKILGE